MNLERVQVEPNSLNGIYKRAKVVAGQILKLGESIQIDRSGYIYLSNFI